MSRLSYSTRLSGERHTQVTDEVVARSQRRVRMFVNDMTSSGSPPGTVPVNSEVEEYTNLLAALNAGDPRFESDPAAQARLQQLEAKFGGPAPNPPTPQPISGNQPMPLSALQAATKALAKNRGMQ